MVSLILQQHLYTTATYAHKQSPEFEINLVLRALISRTMTIA